MTKIPFLCKLTLSSVIAAGLAFPAHAEQSAMEDDIASSTVVVDDVKIEIRANKSTKETLNFPELSDDSMASAYLPGAFEATAAGEAESANQVTRGVNDDVLVYSDKSESNEIRYRRAQDKEKSKRVVTRSSRSSKKSSSSIKTAATTNSNLPGVTSLVSNVSSTSSITVLSLPDQ